MTAQKWKLDKGPRAGCTITLLTRAEVRALPTGTKLVSISGREKTKTKGFRGGDVRPANGELYTTYGLASACKR